MYYDSIDVVFQEVPGEISLAFVMSGCQLQCPGCHSSYTWKTKNKQILTEEYFESYIGKYVHLITCILFMGGEWNDSLSNFLVIAKRYGFKTCLYTGLTLEEIENKNINLTKSLDFIKVGRWDPEKGSLNKTHTNQQFLKLPSKENLTHLFQKD